MNSKKKSFRIETVKVRCQECGGIHWIPVGIEVGWEVVYEETSEDCEMLYPNFTCDKTGKDLKAKVPIRRVQQKMMQRGVVLTAGDTVSRKNPPKDTSSGGDLIQRDIPSPTREPSDGQSSSDGGKNTGYITRNGGSDDKSGGFDGGDDSGGCTIRR